MGAGIKRLVALQLKNHFPPAPSLWMKGSPVYQSARDHV